ncbi:MAG: hypothetical protein AAGI53_13850 [Planctomycetota bacterium]
MHRAIALSAFTLVGTSFAQITLFEDRAGWHAAAGSPVLTEGFERFEDLGAVGAYSEYGTGLGVDVSSGSIFAAVEVELPITDMYNITPGGNQYLRFGDLDDTDAYTVRFSIPQATHAFGFDFSDWEAGRGAGPITGALVEFSLGGQIVSGTFVESNNTASGLINFVGFTSDFAFDDVQISFTPFDNTNQWADGVGFDEVAFAVPAPGSVALFGLSGLALTRHRR